MRSKLLCLVVIGFLSCADTNGEPDILSVEIDPSFLIVHTTSKIDFFNPEKVILLSECLSCDEIPYKWYVCTDTEYNTDRCFSSSQKTIATSVTKIILKPSSTLKKGKYILLFNDRVFSDESPQSTFIFDL